jgi:hypothetical protein
MQRSRVLSLSLGLIGLPLFANASLLPPGLLDAVVAVGTDVPVPPTADTPSHVEWYTTGTGFFYGQMIKPDPDPKKRQYRVFLVTARHVVDENFGKKDAAPTVRDLKAKLNPKASHTSAEEFNVPTKTEGGQKHGFSIATKQLT